MSTQQTYYAYNPNKPLTAAEQQVQAMGYPYVSTTVLGPRNTHLIVSGSIFVGRSREGVARFRSGAEEYGHGSEVVLPKNVDYIGTAGAEGCVFVEGHTVLSPSTADRFFDRETIVKVTETTKGAFTTEGH